MKNRKMNMLKQLILLPLILVTFTACSPSSILTSNAPPETTYTLTPKSYNNTEKPAKFGRIRMDQVRAAPHLATDRIIIKKGARELDHYAEALWVLEIPDLVQGFVQSSLENRFGPVVVGSDDTRLHPKNILQIEVRDFQAEYEETTDEPPKIRVTLNAYILDWESREQMNPAQITKTVKATDNTLAAVTAAFEKALRKSTDQLITSLASHRE